MPIKPRDVIDANDPRVSQIGHPAPPWLVNYADLMTELVCFFIILYALSAALDPNQQKVQKEVKSTAEETNAPVETKMTKDGLEITLKETEGAALFESGKADLTEHAKEVIDKIVPVFLKVPNDIVVEGHTDNDRVIAGKTPFASNWELSSARATNVVKYLIEQKSIPPNRLAAIGYGEYRPIVPNDTIQGKARNRRVVFLVKLTKQEKKTDEKSSSEITTGNTTSGISNSTMENTDGNTVGENKGGL